MAKKKKLTVALKKGPALTACEHEAAHRETVSSNEIACRPVLHPLFCSLGEDGADTTRKGHVRKT